MSDCGNRTPERRKILGELNNMKSEQPDSPTANLRLLTSLASNLINASELGSIQNNNKTNDCLLTPTGSMSLKLLPRKQKSLGLLCKKFLNLYPLDLRDDIPQEISLDGTAKILGTEKRRIYDIINVLESLEMASKAGKNRYLWHGQNGLTATLNKLKSIAIRLGLREQIREIQKMNKAYTGDYEDLSSSSSSLSSSSSASYSNEFIMCPEELADEEIYSDTSMKEDKSLGAMCQKFVMLFLVSMKNGVINLDIAAKVLIIDMGIQTPDIADNASRSRFKTKVRRLYDIANVLTAIGLIKKVDMNDRMMKKPIFKYIGPHVHALDSNDDTPTRGIQDSSIGMSTPNKRPHTFPRAIRFDAPIDGSYKTLEYDPTTTPFTEKRKPRKRKLFDSDSSLIRAYSTTILEGKSVSLERLNDSILRVAEMELERLNSSEEFKPKACTKLFTKYNSDSCITNTNSVSETERGIKSDCERSELIMRTPPASSSNALPVFNNQCDTQVSKQLNDTQTTVSIASHQSRNIVPVISNENSKVELQPLKKNIIKSLPIVKIASLNTIHPRHIISTSLLANNMSRLTRCEVKPSVQAPKLISLGSLDPKKWISIKKCDIKLLAPNERMAMNNVNTLSTDYAMLTRIRAPVVSPGDTFRAIKVGNTLQLVPMRDQCIENSNNDRNVENLS